MDGLAGTKFSPYLSILSKMIGPPKGVEAGATSGYGANCFRSLAPTLAPSERRSQFLLQNIELAFVAIGRMT